MVDWKPIAELPEELKDGRALLLWCSWADARVKFSQPADWQDEPVAARWYWPGGVVGGGKGYWALVQSGEGAFGDEVNAEQVTHYAEIQAPE